MSPIRRASRELTPDALNKHLWNIFGTEEAGPFEPAPIVGGRGARVPSLLSAAGSDFEAVAPTTITPLGLERPWAAPSDIVGTDARDCEAVMQRAHLLSPGTVFAV